MKSVKARAIKAGKFYELVNLCEQDNELDVYSRDPHLLFSEENENNIVGTLPAGFMFMAITNAINFGEDFYYPKIIGMNEELLGWIEIWEFNDKFIEYDIQDL